MTIKNTISLVNNVMNETQRKTNCNNLLGGKLWTSPDQQHEQ